MLGRRAQADTESLLDNLATAYALVEAIENTHGLLPSWLAGQARSLYEDSEILTLAGLGGYSWKTPSGYLGLTLLFLDIGSNEILTWSDVRPETTSVGFDPMQRYEELCNWRGGAAIKTLASSVFLLHGVRRNEEG